MENKKETFGYDPQQLVTKIQFIPKLSLKDDLDREIYYRGIVSDNGYDWVYDDIDRIYELFCEVKSDNSNLADEITNFVEYAAGKFNMTSDEEEILDYIVRGFDWDDPLHCIDILSNDIKIDVANFLQKYNFTLSIGVINEIAIKNL